VDMEAVSGPAMAWALPPCPADSTAPTAHGAFRALSAAPTAAYRPGPASLAGG